MQPGVAYEPTAFMAAALEFNALRLENFNSSAFHLELKHRDTFCRGSHRNDCSGIGVSRPQTPNRARSAQISRRRFSRFSSGVGKAWKKEGRAWFVYFRLDPGADEFVDGGRD
jgi:hypothetical protein